MAPKPIRSPLVFGLREPNQAHGLAEPGERLQRVGGQQEPVDEEHAAEQNRQPGQPLRKRPPPSRRASSAVNATVADMASAGTNLSGNSAVPKNA